MIHLKKLSNRNPILKFFKKGLLLILVFLGSQVMGQQTVNGTVSDPDGPLPGATVIV